MRDKLIDCKNIVLKFGTNVLISLLSNEKSLQKLIEDIVKYRNKGYNISIVSSGAVGFGMNKLKMEKRPHQLEKIQALASIGQSLLMKFWTELFEKNNQCVSQILLTYDLVENRQRFLNTQKCIQALLKYQVIPIINENDSVAIEELKFTDNDNLSVMTSLLSAADLLILFTNTNGLFDKNPHKDNTAKRLSLVDKIDEKTFSLVQDFKNDFSKGGMYSKLNSAYLATNLGIHTLIVSGEDPDFDGIMQGEDLGTYFLAKENKLPDKKKWLYMNKNFKGSIYIDEGAKKAILEEGKSLLPSGIIKVKNDFLKGNLVGIYDEKGKLLAKGISFFDKNEIEKIMGKQSEKINDILQKKVSFKEIIDRNNMLIINK